VFRGARKIDLEKKKLDARAEQALRATCLLFAASSFSSSNPQRRGGSSSFGRIFCILA